MNTAGHEHSRLRATILPSVLFVALSFVLLVHFELLRKLPFFHCESFGCIGLGVLYLLIGLVLIPLCFFGVYLLLSPPPRLKLALLAASAAFLANVLSFLAIFILAQMRLSEDVRNAREACVQYPILCPPAPEIPGESAPHGENQSEWPGTAMPATVPGPGTKPDSAR